MDIEKVRDFWIEEAAEALQVAIKMALKLPPLAPP